MVSGSVIAGYIFSGILSLLFPIAAFIYFRKKEKILVRPALTGVLIFVVFALVLEAALNFYLLNVNKSTAFIKTNPYYFAGYGALAAGVFEETGRYVAFAWMLKKFRERRDALAYGAGHGGIEMIIVGAFACLQYIVLSGVVNSGALDGWNLPADTAQQIKVSMLGITAEMSFMMGIERVLAFFIQLALSLMVFYGVKNKKIGYFFLALLLHTAIDFVVVIGTVLKFGTFVNDLILLVFAVLAAVYIRKTKAWSSEENHHPIEIAK
ncbi:YhfC family intramembrane metalloprotease [Metabacillus sp. GX 13764]|uniref:YhfC family intramembrane metalloprotease n=1 Tax=Metabacillus kandeliae TaxID=2900151 RepID=UPI001E2BE3D3|nr:YhfC family glutamic-type intramembrane protease [Metabacillus kandeliae]MCD7034007.1 YhfC family intramembrane metalloprotease [Metabacillus kandeliae]